MTRRPLVALPIDPALPEVIRKLESTPNLVLQASPGSGKTTRVAPALLNSKLLDGKEILILEPRRLAAKYAARRVSDERGESVGKTVGYQFRFENVTSAETRIRFLTEGMLMRRLLGDPELKGVGAVLLDEFHERHLHGDVALAYLRWLQSSKRPDLRILVMSATLDSEAVATYLGNCPIVRVDTPVYPVKIEHLPSPPARQLEFAVRDAVASALRDPEVGEGNILVFLPGMAEIRRAASALEDFKARGILVLPLHGELSREEQDLAVSLSKDRKIILSTNVAETSLTIPGVTAVVDSGLHRQASHSWWSGVPALRTRPISRASAIQRTGRAGRTAPGKCFRLYTLGDFNSRPPFDTPEISRADIAQILLELKTIGIADFSHFPWFEAPSPQALDASRKLLYRLGALDSESGSSRLTALGRRMAELPAHPRISRFLLEAEKAGVTEDAATFAALYNEGRIESLDALSALESGRRDELLRRTRSHFLSGLNPKQATCPRDKAEARLSFALLTGFPDRVARKRKMAPGVNRGRDNEVELTFSFGGSARVEDCATVASHELFIVLDIQEQQHLGQARSQPKVRTLLAIEPEWLLDLEPSGIREVDELDWDSERKRAFQVSRMNYDELVLSESRTAPKPGEALTRLVLKEVLSLAPEIGRTEIAAYWISGLGRVSDPEALESMLARISLLARSMKSAQATYDPAKDDLWPCIEQVLDGKASEAELREIDWPNALASVLVPDLLHDLDRLVPATVALPSGRKARVNYRFNQPPWLESRLQDFFGMKSGPAILGGQLPITLHLLAPNMRAIQVTTDLAGFWTRAYAEQRHALSRRYPRHYWPENPLEAEPPTRR